MPKKEAYSDEIIRMAATLYYVDGLGQTEVANLVRVTVEEYKARNDKLEHQLCSRFGLKSAAVIRTAKNADGEAARQTVGHFGAPFVASLLPTSGEGAVGPKSCNACGAVSSGGSRSCRRWAASTPISRAWTPPNWGARW